MRSLHNEKPPQNQNGLENVNVVCCIGGLQGKFLLQLS